MFQPVHRLAIELLLDGDVGHRRRWRRPVPVLFAWREPNDVTGPNLLDWPTPTLGAANAGCHDQRLAERMGVPRRPRTGLERHTRAGSARRHRRVEQWIDADRSGEPLGGTLRRRL